MSMDLALEKGLPASLDCERLVLGALLTGTEFQLVAGVVQVGDFSLEKHRRIFECMAETYKSGTRIDTVSIAEGLRRRNQLESCDGVGYLVDLFDVPDRLVNLDYYCKTVKDKSILRRTIFNSQKVINQCLADQDSPDEILAHASDLLRGLEGETAAKATLLSFAEILDGNGGLNTYCQSEEPGIPTPWPSLNRVIGGFRPGQVATLAGLTSSGKSAAALQIAQYAAGKVSWRCVFFIGDERQGYFRAGGLRSCRHRFKKAAAQSSIGSGAAQFRQGVFPTRNPAAMDR